jgi:hypothetical protein
MHSFDLSLAYLARTVALAEENLRVSALKYLDKVQQMKAKEENIVAQEQLDGEMEV